MTELVQEKDEYDNMVIAKIYYDFSSKGSRQKQMTATSKHRYDELKEALESIQSIISLISDPQDIVSVYDKQID
ncbi:hypothetical protein CHS0354_024199 [Potamilus streckersoni]|uniref:Uncharacterized protein n=1 Tax=Potamilus streckersoni TaxID=2493646 RepID=A0AAE0RY56_9BIVA|nr:hypothetical protein CHS0354_024199 [Potamilus streckersoni]